MAESITRQCPPYLTLSISQALSLPAPRAPEPKQHGSVNSMLDERADRMPDQLAVGFTYLGSDGRWNCSTLTYAQVSRLALGLAIELHVQIPGRSWNTKSPNHTPLVAVLSPSGLDLFAHIIALWRLGFGVLCIAPGSPAESIANLLSLTQTNVVLAHASQVGSAHAAVQAARDGVNEHVFEAQVYTMISNVLQLVDGDTYTRSAIASQHIAQPDDVLVAMHTSGSSGLPKPIYQLHRFWTTSMLSAAGRDLSAFTTTPLFHGGMSDLLRSFQAGSSIFFHPTADPGALGTSAICRAIKACNTRISYFLSVPYVLDMLYTERVDDGRRMLSSMQLVSTGGAPLPQHLGDSMVHQGIKLVSRLGSSECGFLMSSWRSFATDKTWNHLRLDDDLGQGMLHFEAHDGISDEPLFELVVTKDWPTKLVANREDGSYATSDLYSKQGDHRWKYESRSDDTILLVSGKKATAAVVEQKLKASPLVTEAIGFGANRGIIGALVFVSTDAIAQGASWDDALKIKLLNQLESVLVEINCASPPHAQLAPEMICLLPPCEAAHIPYASKGTLQRARAYQQYADLINSIYLDFDQGRSLQLDTGTRNAGVAKQQLSGETLIHWLQGKVESINAKKLSPDVDLFVAGIDSIQSARIRAAVHQNVDLDEHLLERNVVYEYPTLRLLAQHIEDVRAGSGSSDVDHQRQQRELALMQELVQRYSQPSLHVEWIRENSREKGAQAGILYMLTGVTGGLGVQILDQVVRHKLQAHDFVVCLIRADSDQHAQKRLLDTLRSRRLEHTRSVVASTSQIHALAVDISRAHCGIASSQLWSLLASGYSKVVTIHSAWSVNFVASLSSFEPENIAGLSHLISLHQSLVACLTSAHESESCFTFCSSVASVLASSSQIVDETLSTSPLDAAPMGYARSKWVAEHIVSRRFRSGGSRIVRIGQLCSDTTHGVWNQNEAWPILIRLSCQLGCFPDLNQNLDWIPTDIAAITVLLASLSPGSGVLNMAQPTTHLSKCVPWKSLYDSLVSCGLTLSLVSPHHWLHLLQHSNADHRGLLGLWLRNFEQQQPQSQPEPALRFNCTKSLAVSSQLRIWQHHAVTQSLIQKTVQTWKQIGFLS